MLLRLMGRGRKRLERWMREGEKGLEMEMYAIYQQFGIVHEFRSFTCIQIVKHSSS